MAVVTVGVGSWRCDLRIGRVEEFHMTKWIDEFASSLNSDEQRRNVEYQRSLLIDRLIRDHGPEFFAALAKELRAQTVELNEKVGGVFKGVTASDERNPHSVQVTTGDNRMKLVCSISRDHRKLTVDGERQGALRPWREEFSISVDPDTATIRATATNERYDDPQALATRLLETVFRR